MDDAEMEKEHGVEDHEAGSPPGFSNMDNFSKEGFSIIKESIKSANELPLSDYNSFNLKKSFRNIMTSESNRLSTMMNNISKCYGVRGNFKSSSLEFRANLLVETNDSILEKVADSTDEINGIQKYNSMNPLEDGKTKTSINGSWNRVRNPTVSTGSNSIKQADDPSSVLKLSRVEDIKRPQDSFIVKIDNSNDHPWEPRIKEKPNSIKPLAIFLEETERGEEFSHPYEIELEKFDVSPEQLSQEEEEPAFPKTLEETNFVEVDSEEKLQELVEDLRKYDVIAIDLEHHSYRTFMGLTCLMQISTGDTDYIIDTLILRDKLYVLNEIFTKPSVVKIFHGADSDILWLQRDLSLYIVNMFDTHQAAKILGYSSLSLASLLERFCNFSPDKHFQMADWRMRPLPDALKKYAREDTHYLIYIYKIMKKELFKKSRNNSKLLSIVFERSTEICKRRYFKPRCTEESYLDFYESCKRMFNKKQMYALKEIYNWRDQIARSKDESVAYVLPNHMMFQIAEILPKEMQGILACCNPVPPLVRSNLLELHQMILKARDIKVDQPILQEDTRARGTMIKKQKFDLDNPFNSPFDTSKKTTNMEDVTVLLENDKFNIIDLLNETQSFEKASPIFSIMAEEIAPLEKPLRNFRILTPFERYNCTKFFILEEKKEKEQQITDDQNRSDVKPEIPEIIEIEEDVEKIYENLDSLTEDNKTDKERMALLTNHFNLLSHKTQEDVDTEKRLEEQLYQKASSLITERVENLADMGTSRKRRREESDEDESDKETEEKFMSPARIKSENSPGNRRKQNSHRNNTPNRVQNKNRKRKSTEASGYGSPPKKNKFGSPQKTTQNERHNNQEEFEAFDYSSVDFRQFQGGGGHVNKGRSIGSKFKSKRSSRGKKY